MGKASTGGAPLGNRACHCLGRLTAAVHRLAILDIHPWATTVLPRIGWRGLGAAARPGHVAQSPAGQRAGCPRAPGCEAPIHSAEGEDAGQLPIEAGAEWGRRNS